MKWLGFLFFVLRSVAVSRAFIELDAVLYKLSTNGFGDGDAERHVEDEHLEGALEQRVVKDVEDAGALERNRVQQPLYQLLAIL